MVKVAKRLLKRKDSNSLNLRIAFGLLERTLNHYGPFGQSLIVVDCQELTDLTFRVLLDWPDLGDNDMARFSAENMLVSLSEINEQVNRIMGDLRQG